MKRTYRHLLIVKGFGSFPIDMLRYDGCIPYSEADAGKIQRTFFAGSSNEEIQVYKITESKVSPWTLARWESFGWKKVREEVVL